MTDPEAPPRPDGDAPKDDLHRQVARLADAGDAAGVIALLAPLPASRVTPRLLQRLATAAVQAGSREAARQAADLAIKASLAPEERARIAGTLAARSLGEPLAALLVLASDPAVFRAPQAEGDVIKLLGAVAKADSPLLAAAALAARQRLLRVVRVAFEPLPAPAIGGLDPRPPPPRVPLRLLRAPGVGPDAEALFRRLEDGFERDLGRGRDPSTQVLRNVFVNAAGQVWQADGGLVVDGLNGGDPAPLPPASLAAMTEAPRLPEAEFATLRPNAGNFFHWMINGLPALWRHGVAGGPPLLTGKPPARFVRESLELAGASPAMVPAGDATFVERLHVSWSPLAALASGRGARLLHDRLIAAADAGTPPEDASPLIYLSRRDSRYRAMANEEALEQSLAERGFRALAFQGRPLLDQLRIIRAARVIVAPHGAGLSHLAFARPGVAVLELMPLVDSLSLRFNMARLSRLMGHRHALWIEAADARNQWRADIAALLPAVMRMVEGDGADG